MPPLIDTPIGKVLNSPSLAIDPLATDRDILAATLRAAAAITGTPVLDAKRLTRGGNNVTLMLETADGTFVAKHYPVSADDPRDRFRAETEALCFMNAAAFDCVPALVGSDADARVAVMDYSGSLAAREPGDDDIAACIRFAARLHEARGFAGAGSLSPAAEACLAPGDVSAQVRARRARLEDVAADHIALSAFLNDAFDPAFEDYESARIAILGPTSDGGPGKALGRSLQTLSPSDFGMHNAVSTDSGKLIFVDFEYFGWDDPVRLVCDFILHPGHTLKDTQKHDFARDCAAIFSVDDVDFQQRLSALYPLIGLRWCLIILNQFLPERMARRRAAGNIADLDAVLTDQLEKARRLLAGLDNGKRLVTE